MIDIGGVRADTPGVSHVAHFNNCGSALMPRPVLDAMQRHLVREAEIGGYEAEDEAADALTAVYESLARLLGAGSREIALVENATRAWDMVVYGMRFEAGDRILTAQAEYASNYLAFLQLERRLGVEVAAVPDDDAGQLDVAALDAMIDDRTRLIAVTHVPSGGGLVNPAADIGRVARAHGVPFLLDACQSVGQMPVDVDELQVDILSATSRKFLRGPRGVGFLYVRDGLIASIEPAMVDLRAATWVAPDRYELRSDARRFETFEGNVAGRIGLGVAVDYALAIGLKHIRRRVFGLADRLRAGLAALPGVTVRDTGAVRCGIVTFTLDGTDPDTIKRHLAADGIHVSTSTAATALLDFRSRGLDAVVRAGVHYYNTEEEVERLLGAVRSLADQPHPA